MKVKIDYILLIIIKKLILTVSTNKEINWSSIKYFSSILEKENYSIIISIDELENNIKEKEYNTFIKLIKDIFYFIKHRNIKSFTVKDAINISVEKKYLIKIFNYKQMVIEEINKSFNELIRYLNDKDLLSFCCCFKNILKRRKLNALGNKFVKTVEIMHELFYLLNLANFQCLIFINEQNTIELKKLKNTMSKIKDIIYKNQFYNLSVYRIFDDFLRLFGIYKEILHLIIHIYIQKQKKLIVKKNL